MPRGQVSQWKSVMPMGVNSRSRRKAYGAQDLRTAKYTFSACKSVVSLAIGLLADDGALSVKDQAADFFEDPGSTASAGRKGSVGVRTSSMRVSSWKVRLAVVRFIAGSSLAAAISTIFLSRSCPAVRSPGSSRPADTCWTGTGR